MHVLKCTHGELSLLQTINWAALSFSFGFFCSHQLFRQQLEKQENNIDTRQVTYQHDERTLKKIEVHPVPIQNLLVQCAVHEYKNQTDSCQLLYSDMTQVIVHAKVIDGQFSGHQRRHAIDQGQLNAQQIFTGKLIKHRRKQGSCCNAHRTNKTCNQNEQQFKSAWDMYKVCAWLQIQKICQCVVDGMY